MRRTNYPNFILL